MNLKKRFEIFKRDNFTCQYCGKRPPEVVLEVDHIISKKDGGKDNDENLITSCFECNRGKGKMSVNKFDYKSELKKIEESKIQLDEYYNFLKEKNSLKDKELEIFSDYWEELSGNKYSLTKNGLQSFKKMKAKYNLEDILDSMKISWEKTNIEPENKIKYIFGILKIKELQKNNPEEAGKQIQIRENINAFYDKWNNLIGGYLKWDVKVFIRNIFESEMFTKEEILNCVEECKRSFKNTCYGSYSDYFTALLEDKAKDDIPFYLVK